MIHSQGDLSKVVLYVDVRPTSAHTQGYAFVNEDGMTSDIPFNDFWLHIPLYRSHKIVEYVDVQKDDTIQKIPRQEINPFYLEYSFFDGIQRNKVNNGYELTDTMVNFIRSKRSDVQEMTNEQIREWYDYVGKNELPWDAPDGSKVTVDDIETAQTILTSIVSKAKTLRIDIYK